MVNLNEIVPDFPCSTTKGDMTFHSYIQDSWAILFSHPADFTPVCTTELGRVAALAPEFQRRGIKLIALSCDSVESHSAWLADIEATQGQRVDYPIIGDEDRAIATMWGMLQPGLVNMSGMPLTCRSVFIIGPDKKLKLSILYPASTGRNFDEILRVVDSLQLSAAHPIATPVDWVPGQDCIVAISVRDEDCAEKFPKGVRSVTTPSGKNYLRYTPNP